MASINANEASSSDGDSRKDEVLMDYNDNVIEIDEIPIVNVLSDTIIDLTEDDYEPASKKLNLKGVPPRNTFNSIRLHKPGTSSQLQVVQEINKCDICTTSVHFVKYNYFSCGHVCCNYCSRASFLHCKDPEVMCPEANCRTQISDDVIKNSLDINDYILFLEHYREVLREALKLSDLQTTFTGADLQTEVQIIEDSVSPPHQPRRRSFLTQCMNLDLKSYVENIESFQCPICFEDIPVGGGIVLKSCLHMFCMHCLRDSINYSDDQLVKCPYNSELGSCEFFLEAREVRGILEPEDLDKYHAKALKLAETSLDNGFHCKTLNCNGFVELQDGVTAFACPICDMVNCIKCKVIHEDKTCEQYKADLINDEKNQHELQLTEESIKAMLEKGEVSFFLLDKKEFTQFYNLRRCCAQNAIFLFRRTQDAILSYALHASLEYVTARRSLVSHSRRQSMASRSPSTDATAERIIRSVTQSVQIAIEIRIFSPKALIFHVTHEIIQTYTHLV